MLRCETSHQFKNPLRQTTSCLPTELPRSGSIQQPGVAAQRHTPGQRLVNRLYAEGVPQFRTRSFTPIRIAHRIRHRICALTVEAHPETSPFDDAPAGSGCSLSTRQRVTDSQRTLRNPVAIGTRRPLASTTSKIHVSVHARDWRLTMSLQVGRGCERDPQRLQPAERDFRDYDTRLRGRHEGRFVIRDFSNTACGVSSKIRRAGKSAQAIGPLFFALLLSDQCRTLSAYLPVHILFLECAASRRPQANECNRFAVSTMTIGEALCA